MASDVGAWATLARELGLRVELLENGNEVEVTNWRDQDRGTLWLGRLDTLKIEPGDCEIKTIQRVEALQVMARLRGGG